MFKLSSVQILSDPQFSVRKSRSEWLHVLTLRVG